MAPNSTNDPSSIFEEGNLKPGIYKIQNVFTETFADIEMHSRQVCCRPAKDLAEGRGLWEIKSLGDGYTVRRVQSGEPEQFCTTTDVLGPPHPPAATFLSVAAYPVAWRVEIVNDDKHRGFEYIRLCWGTTEFGWVVACWSKDNGAKVHTWTENNRDSVPLLMWKLIPVKVEGIFTPPHLETAGSDSLPPYAMDATGKPSVRARHVESERDDFGTTVNEVTTVTTTSTVTTRKKYRVEDA